MTAHHGLSVILFVLLVAQCALAEGGRQSAEELDRARREAAFHPRGLIYNNDGDDALAQVESVSPEALLARRTIGIEGSHVGAIAYSTTRSFAGWTHDTRPCPPFLVREGAFQHNMTDELIRQGTDPLRVIVEWCHANDLEAFWSMRVNDTHDAGNVPMRPQWKLDRPHLLMGTDEQRPRYGGWTAVDYGEEEVRDLAFEVIADVLRRYDVDGVELDFYRHPVLFRAHAQGGQATDENRAQFTELLRRVRAEADAIGAERGRPILISARVPDSLDYAAAIGLDLRTWIEERLLDIVIPSGYVQFVPWRETVALCHANGVACYPCLSNATMRDLANRALRGNIETYRARAVNAWAAGADGLQIFNVFNQQHPLWRELGDPQALAGRDKRYFVTFLGPRMAAAYLGDGGSYVTIPTLCTDAPVTIEPGQAHAEPIEIAEDITAGGTLSPEVELSVQFEELPPAGTLAVSINGRRLVVPDTDENWLRYRVPAEAVREGDNSVRIEVAADAAAPVVWREAYVDVRYPEAAE